MANPGGELLARLGIVDTMTPGMGKAARGIKASVSQISAGLATAGLAIGGLVNRGSEIVKIETAFTALAANAGVSADAMVAHIKRGGGGMVTEFDAMATANKALLLGLPVTAEGMGDLAATAATLGQAMGQDVNTSFNDLITALGRSSPMILDNLGLTVKVGEANQTYADQLGKTVKELSGAEKKQAFFNAAMDAAKAKVEAIGGPTITATGQFKQLSVWVQDNVDKAAVWTEKLGIVGGALGGAATGALGFLNQLGPMGAALAAQPRVMMAVGGAAKFMWSALTGPIGWVIGGVTLLAGAWVLWGDEIKAFVAGVWNGFIGKIETFLPLLAKVGKFIGVDMPSDLSSWKMATVEVVDAQGDLAQAVQEVDNTVSVTGGTTVPALGDALDDAADKTDLAAEAAKRITGIYEGLIDVNLTRDVNELRAAIASMPPEWEKNELALARVQAAIAATVKRGSFELVKLAPLMTTQFELGLSRLSDMQAPAGNMAGQLFAGAYMHSVDRQINATLPQIVGGIGTLPAFAESGLVASSAWKQGFDSVVSAGNISATIARAFEGGGGWMGGVKSIGAQAGGSLIEGMKAGTLGELPGLFGKVGGKVTELWSKVSGAVSAIPFAGPILAAFGPQILQGLGFIGKKVWGSIKRMFGGASEAQLAARELWHGFAAEAKAVLGETAAYQAEVQRATSEGWAQATAEARASFIMLGQQAGLTYDQADAAYGEWTAAMEAGDTKRMAAIEERFGAELDAFTGLKDAEAEAAEAAVEREIAARERAQDAALGAFERATAAGLSAYESTKKAAIDAGKTEEQATDQAERARRRAIAETLKAEKNKFVRSSAMEAALAAIRSGNAEGALEAARNAAQEARQAWNVSLDATRAADEATTTAMEGGSERRGKASRDEAKRTETETVAASRTTQETVTRNLEAAQMAGVAAFELLKRGAVANLQNMGDVAEGTKRDINSSLDGIRKHVRISIVRNETTNRHTNYSQAGKPPPGRADGGPVQAGRQYLVGERGPELFTAPRHGGIIPNNEIGVRSGSGGDRKVKLEIELSGYTRSGTSLARHLAEAVAEELPEVLGEKGLT